MASRMGEMKELLRSAVADMGIDARQNQALRASTDMMLAELRDEGYSPEQAGAMAMLLLLREVRDIHPALAMQDSISMAVDPARLTRAEMLAGGMLMGMFDDGDRVSPQ